MTNHYHTNPLSGMTTSVVWSSAEGRYLVYQAPASAIPGISVTGRYTQIATITPAEDAGWWEVVRTDGFRYAIRAGEIPEQAERLN